jgi:hypothetical protein
MSLLISILGSSKKVKQTHMFLSVC